VNTEEAERGGSEATDILDLLLAIARKKRILLGVPAVVATVAGLATLFVANEYTSTARILPPQQQASASAAALLAQLSGPAAVLGSAVSGRPSDLYAGMLKGHTIADRLIAKFKLQELYDESTMVDTRRELAKHTDISAGRDGIISISFEDIDAQRAAAIANGYAEELQQLAQGLALTEAAQRRLFFEQQLAKARDQLSQAEGDLKKTQEKTGLIQLDQQGRAIIEAIARLRAEIAAREVQIAALKTYATDSNPDFILLRQQLVGLRSELAKLERSGAGGGIGDVLIPTGKVPEAGLEYIRRVRDLKYSEAVMEILARQYEIARLDEAKDIALIQVVDRAVPPDRKSGPKRALIMIASAFIAMVFSFLWLVVQFALERARKNPATEAKLRALRGTFSRL
jgi:tyrosine-protein kinase Etk/Wzc